MKYLPFIMLIVGAYPATASSPVTLENLTELEAKVALATGVPTGSPGGATGPIDPRIRLQKCPAVVLVDKPFNDAIAIRCSLLGWRIRVPLLANLPNRPASSAGRIPLVRRGDVVELIYEAPSFAATTSAIALDEGGEGKIVRVKTSSSATPITATVTGIGEVRIAH